MGWGAFSTRNAWGGGGRSFYFVDFEGHFFFLFFVEQRIRAGWATELALAGAHINGELGVD